jgi:uncharacterized protein
VLKWKLGLKGIFGIDFLVDEDDVPWVTEVNPRYPASSELLEFATGYSLLGEHARCFAPDDVPEPACVINPPGEPYLGKAVLYAPRPLTWRGGPATQANPSLAEFPEIADVPEDGQTFSAGDPVCTLFAAGRTLENCWDTLQERLRQLEAGLPGDTV